MECDDLQSRETQSTSIGEPNRILLLSRSAAQFDLSQLKLGLTRIKLSFGN
jgi:hypothetical protein